MCFRDVVRVSHPPAILMELDETQALVPRYEEDEEDEDQDDEHEDKEDYRLRDMRRTEGCKSG